MDRRDLEKYCSEVVRCLVEYGGLSEADASNRVARSEICHVLNEMSWKLLIHEYPYYWAMTLLHERDNPDWHKDPQLWPPPREYVEDFLRRWSSSGEDS